MEFERQQYMVGPERLYLAHTLQLTEAQVSTGIKLLNKLTTVILLKVMLFSSRITRPKLCINQGLKPNIFFPISISFSVSILIWVFNRYSISVSSPALLFCRYWNRKI